MPRQHERVLHIPPTTRPPPENRPRATSSRSRFRYLSPYLRCRSAPRRGASSRTPCSTLGSLATLSHTHTFARPNKGATRVHSLASGMSRAVKMYKGATRAFSHFRHVARGQNVQLLSLIANGASAAAPGTRLSLSRRVQARPASSTAALSLVTYVWILRPHLSHTQGESR